MAMRDQIKEAIEAGGATRESLLELTGTTEKGLASQFTYMRMMGNCPMKQADGTFKIVSAQEWEDHKGASSGAAASSLTPEQRVEKAEKRSKRAAAAYDNAKKRAEANADNRLYELKFIKAEAEFEIAEIELGKAEEAFMYSSHISEVEEEEDLEDEEDEDLEEEDEDLEEDDLE
jgi:hypothetical protein